jgi:hypothetical protein
MHIDEISARSVVYELDHYINENRDVNHMTAELPFPVSEAAFMDIHDNGCTALTLWFMAHVLGDLHVFDETRVGLLVRYVQGLIGMGDMAGHDFAQAVRDERVVHVAAAA